jgi:hypothetical protein
MTTVDKALRELIQHEVKAMIAPLVATIAELRAQQAVIERLATALGQPLKRGPGRPKKLALPAPAPRAPGERHTGRVDNANRECAVIGCLRPARSKGYCGAHYQKYRMLALTDRLPAGWVDDAAPQSVENVVLPRGRAGAKALAEAKIE